MSNYCLSCRFAAAGRPIVEIHPAAMMQYQFMRTVLVISQRAPSFCSHPCIIFPLRGEIPGNEELLSREDIIKLKGCVYYSQKHSLPPICTHNVVNDYDDQILNAIRNVKLFNNRHDRVKVSRQGFNLKVGD